MIYLRDSGIEVRWAEGVLVVREHDTVRSWMRIPVGLFLMGVGMLVWTMFASNEGLRPPPASLGKFIVGSILLILLFLLLGVGPFLWGLELLFVRRRYVVDVPRQRVQSQWMLGSRPIWTRTYPWSAFSEVRVQARRFSGLATNWRVVVSLAGAGRAADWVGAADWPQAMAFASTVGESLQLPVTVLNEPLVL